MSKLLNKLKENREKKEEEVRSDSVVKNVEQFLLHAHEEDVKILHQIGLDHQLEYEKELKQDIHRTAEAEKIYKQETFTGSQIKKLCVTYDLKMLRAQYYKGNIPSDIARIIKAFTERTNTNIADSDNFFILAPTEQFDTIDSNKLNEDPILFYRSETSANSYGEARKSDLFVQIHNWGKDFNDLRILRRFTNTYSRTNDSMPKIFITWVSVIGFLVFYILTLSHNNFIGTQIFTLLFLVGMYFNFKYHKSYTKLWNQNIS